MRKQPTTPLNFHLNRFSILDALSTSSPPPDPPTPQPQPKPNLKPPSQQPTIDKIIHISTIFSTASSRVLSYQAWPHTNPLPQQLARLGFYHRPRDETPDNVCCFICGKETSDWEPVGPYTTSKLLGYHDYDCLWADMLRDVQLCLESASLKSQPVTNTPSPATNLSPLTDKPVDTQPEPAIPLPSPSTSTDDIVTARPTYASVLKTPLNPQPQPQPEPEPRSPPSTPRSPSPFSTKAPMPQSRPSSPTSTLTIADLHERFHNKPPPFKRTEFDQQNSDTPQYDLAVKATKSLSKFLVSALPAFTRFLVDMQRGQYCNHIPYQGARRYNSRLRSTSRDGLEWTQIGQKVTLG
jgi:hypothetical protein